MNGIKAISKALKIKHLIFSDHFNDPKHRRRRTIIEWDCGYGDVICATNSFWGKKKKNRIFVLTSTGVLLVIEDSKFLITAWLATPKEVENFYGKTNLLNEKLFTKNDMPEETWEKVNFHYKTRMCIYGEDD